MQAEVVGTLAEVVVPGTMAEVLDMQAEVEVPGKPAGTWAVLVLELCT